MSLKRFLKCGLVPLSIILLLICYSTTQPSGERFQTIRLIMMTILQTITMCGSYYLYKSYKATFWFNFVMTMCGLSHFSMFATYLFLSEEPTVFIIVPYLAQGLHIYLIMGTIAGDMGTFICIPVTIKILSSYQKFKLHVIPISAIIMTIWAFTNTLLLPQHTDIHVKIKNLPNEFEGFHIMQLSDIHVGPTTGKSYVDWLVTDVNLYHPDLVVITGDLVDNSVKNLKGAVQSLRKLRSTYGTFFVTGNHEYYTGDVTNWFNYLQTLNITPLHNAHSVIEGDKGGQMCLAGIDDPQAEKSWLRYEDHGPRPLAAVSGCPAGSPVIMLAHQPKAAKLCLDTLDQLDLILSGHTHGGQFFPIHIPVYLTNPFFAGLYHPRPDTSVFVSRGLRFYGAPMRLFSYPEYVSIHLHKKK